MLKRLSHIAPGLLPTLALGATSALSIIMVIVRALYTGRLEFMFVFWNSFLAWIPLFCALMARNARGRFAFVTLTATWLLFLPNAPYVLTDLIHYRVRDVPYWYDMLLLVSFAWTGTFAGFLSLYLMQLRIRERWGEAASWAFASVSLMLSSFGIYLGRFLRFNSWDVITNPDELFFGIWARVRHPFAHPRTYVFTILLGAFLIGTYATLVAFARIPLESRVKS
jgi:uncharacterized membrane protein